MFLEDVCVITYYSIILKIMAISLYEKLLSTSIPRPLFSSKFRKHYLTTIYSFLFASFQLYFYYLYYFTSVSAWPYVWHHAQTTWQITKTTSRRKGHIFIMWWWTLTYDLDLRTWYSHGRSYSQVFSYIFITFTTLLVSQLALCMTPRTNNLRNNQSHVTPKRAHFHPVMVNSDLWPWPSNLIQSRLTNTPNIYTKGVLFWT